MASKLDIPKEEPGYIVRGDNPVMETSTFLIQRLSTIIHKNGQNKAIVRLYPNAKLSPIGVWDAVKCAWRVQL